MTFKILAKIDEDLLVTNDANPEIGQRWYPLVLAHDYLENTIELMHVYIKKQGRMKYVFPVYQALVDTDHRDIAYKWFTENYNFYHPIAL